jgi:hypothetical protein
VLTVVLQSPHNPYPNPFLKWTLSPLKTLKDRGDFQYYIFLQNTSFFASEELRVYLATRAYSNVRYSFLTENSSHGQRNALKNRYTFSSPNSCELPFLFLQWPFSSA